jgi:hypothetical protein
MKKLSYIYIYIYMYTYIYIFVLKFSLSKPVVKVFFLILVFEKKISKKNHIFITTSSTFLDSLAYGFI